MLVLYIRPGCHYCMRVLEAANALGIGFELRNIANPAHEAALDEERAVEMYESEDIIRHLQALV
jgi:glutaredoxin